jgi:hypothetical protein
MPRVYFQHFAFEPESAGQFYETIGRVVILWGRLEAIIDTTILTILDHPEATMKRPDEMPLAFKKKMRLWNKVFKQEAIVQQFKDRALKFSKSAKPIARKRNDLIHAAIGEFSPQEQERVTAELIKHKGPNTTLQVFDLVQSEVVPENRTGS